MTSRINKYQDSIIRFTKSKSCFSKFIKDNKILESIISDSDNLAPIILLTVTNNQNKKKGLKTHHGYYMASGIEMLMVMIHIIENKKYYEIKYGKSNIETIISELPIHVFKCLSQNMETLENLSDKDKKDTILKIYHKTLDYLYKKILLINQQNILTGTTKVKKTDIIKYNFSDKKIIDEKYKNLKRVDKDKLINYIDQKYGSIYQCSFYIGWLLGFGDEKLVNNFERLGSHLGLLVKLIRDLQYLERDIDNAVGCSSNMIINYGIHECFSLFYDSKLKLIEGAMILDIYTVTLKEILNHLEYRFNQFLSNTELELKSMYSSFSPSVKKNNNDDSILEENDDI